MAVDGLVGLSDKESAILGYMALYKRGVGADDLYFRWISGDFSDHASAVARVILGLEGPYRPEAISAGNYFLEKARRSNGNGRY